jgi:class 3 adenylate cyclase
MSIKDDLNREVAEIITQTWDIRDGKVVPESKDLALKGGAVRLAAATVLYADLADSTILAMNFSQRVAATVAKAFLATCSRIIRDESGEIRSFDGDRVMAVFLGDMPNTSAARCALKINYCFAEILKPRLEAAYPDLKSKFKLAHGCGVDSSEMLVVRGGIRNNNDLVWIGRAPNVAAKLSDIRDSPYHSWITGEVFDKITKEMKTSSDGRDMWQQRSWNNGPVRRVYRSEWRWTP